MDIIPAELVVEGEVVNGDSWDPRIVDRLRGLGKVNNLSGGQALIAHSIETVSSLMHFSFWHAMLLDP